MSALLLQQFPGLSVIGEADVSNSGNFLIKTAKAGLVLSPYGFLNTSERQRALLEKVAALGNGN